MKYLGVNKNYRTLSKEIEDLNGKIATNKELIEQANEAGKDESYISRLEAENGLLETQIALRAALSDAEIRAANKEAKAAYTSQSYLWGTGEYRESGYRQQGETVREEILQTGTIAEYTAHLLDLAAAGTDVTKELSNCFGQLQIINDGFMTGDKVSEKYAEEIANLSERYNKLFGISQDVITAESSIARVIEKQNGLTKEQYKE